FGFSRPRRTRRGRPPPRGRQPFNSSGARTPSTPRRGRPRYISNQGPRGGGKRRRWHGLGYKLKSSKSGRTEEITTNARHADASTSQTTPSRQRSLASDSHKLENSRAGRERNLWNQRCLSAPTWVIVICI